MPSHRPDTLAPAQAIFGPRSPFRAELPSKGIQMEWRKHIEQAMADARGLGSGARVIAKDGTLLARFENAARYAAPHPRHRAIDSA